MITAKTIQSIKEYVYSQAGKYHAPSIFHLELANEKGQWLAEKFQADKRVVLLGTLLMDCMLGQAINNGKITDHIKMSVEKTKVLLLSFPEITRREKENIIACVREHHGSKKFFSLESEICCNADCYRFASVKGVLGGMIASDNMNLPELISLYKSKAEEKWNALTFDVCKKELAPQYKVILEFLKRF